MSCDQILAEWVGVADGAHKAVYVKRLVQRIGTEEPVLAAVVELLSSTAGRTDADLIDLWHRLCSLPSATMVVARVADASKSHLCVVDSYGWAALHHAVFNRCVDTVAALRRAGAAVDAPRTTRRRDRVKQGWSPEDLARNMNPDAALSTALGAKPLECSGGGSGCKRRRSEDMQQLGQGKFGTVFLTRDGHAVKVTEVKGTHWHHEGVMLMRLSHPHVPRFVSLSLSEDRRCVRLEMEYCAGGCIRPGSVKTQEDMRALLQGVLRALNYLHFQHPPVQHCDVKPSNILWSVDSAGNTVSKLADFGGAREVGVAYPNRPNVGTPRYWSPERAGGKEHGPPDDVWAAAVSMLVAGGIEPAAGDPLTECECRHSIDKFEQRFGTLLAAVLRIMLIGAPERRITSELAANFLS